MKLFKSTLEYLYLTLLVGVLLFEVSELFLRNNELGTSIKGPMFFENIKTSC